MAKKKVLKPTASGYNRKSKTNPHGDKKPGAGGRPSKYREELCQELIDHFDFKDEDRYEIVVEEKYDKNGNVISSTEKKRPKAPPTLYGFARKIGVHMDTLAEWREAYPEFSAAYKKAKDAQADFIISNNMENIGNTVFSIFMMKNNHNWSDKVEQKVEGKMSLENLVGKSFEDGDAE